MWRRRDFEGTRLRDVAGRAGIDHSTLRHHFATKETLVEALVAGVVGRFRPTMPAAGAPRQRLHDHLTGLAALIVELLFAVMSELDQRAHHDPRVRAVCSNTSAAGERSSGSSSTNVHGHQVSTSTLPWS